MFTWFAFLTGLISSPFNINLIFEFDSRGQVGSTKLLFSVLHGLLPSASDDVFNTSIRNILLKSQHYVNVGNVEAALHLLLDCIVSPQFQSVGNQISLNQAVSNTYLVKTTIIHIRVLI